VKHLTPEIRRVIAQLAVLERKLFTAVRAEQIAGKTQDEEHDL
jgi:hypothetical protein